MQTFISGIQQIGVGIPDVKQAWEWYKKHFGMRVPIFDDAGVADLMLPYTGGKPQERHAILAINMQGGGGFEIWQYKKRTPKPANFQLQLGDRGIYAGKIKAKDVRQTYDLFKSRNLKLLSEPSADPAGAPHFYVADPYNNIFDVVSGNSWFSKTKDLTGGSSGATIGVSDIDKSLNYYQQILGYDQVVFDKQGVFPDMKTLPGGNREMRRIMLKHSEKRKGPFSKLLGPSAIELVQALGFSTKKIYQDRYWGDLGFIHMCFDIKGMDGLKQTLQDNGYDFTVDTGNSFDMGKAAGRFAYSEDPDGTLFEFVETFKIPIIEKLGFYLNLNKRPPEKAIPDWMIKAMGIFS